MLRRKEMDIQNIAETILWDGVSDYIENVEVFKKMVVDISYIDHKVADEVEWCEIFDTEEINALGYEVCEKGICIEFEMPFIMSAWKAKQQLFRVTASVMGKAVLENDEIIEIHSLIYDGIEVDSVYL